MKVRLMSPSLSLRRLACVLGLLSIGALGCLESRDQTGPSPGDNACGANCHGNGKTPMPPPDTRGATNTSSPGVGAHELHMAVPSVKGSCNTCHVVPASVDQKGHADDGPPADVRFEEFALEAQRQPSYDPAARTCKNTYCHSGPGRTDPAWPAQAVWTQPRSSSEACGSSCHSLPPAGTHPNSKNCVNCHAETVDSENRIKNASLHINGKVETGQMACTACHGEGQSSAPPKDLAGNTDTTSIGVGAHQIHLAGGDKTRPVKCSECHVEPTSVDDPGHIDTDAPAEVIFTGVGTSNGSTPSWDRSLATCSNSWCHGRPGGTASAPVWTQVDGKQASCGGCHGIPPTAPHPENAFNCEYCHRDNAGPGLTIKDRTRHVDGKVDFAQGCTSCHGFPPAPALSGATETSDIGVGAHAAHLAGGDNSRPLACNECHVMPSELLAPGHIDTAVPAELTFTGVALTDNHLPVWDHAAASCTASYCHGSAAWGGSNPSPIWNQANQATCGSCHGIPPSAPHPQNAPNCEYCHRDTAGPGLAIKDKNRHVDGKLDFATGADCTTCHGNPPAPSLSGATSTSDIGVGAHKAHLEGGKFSRKVACNECHVIPGDMLAAGHIDTGMPAEVTFSGVSVADKVTPVWDRTTATCTSSYCHGGSLLGGSKTNPVWTQAAQADCGSCHGLPPPAPHPNISNCSMCHGSVVNAQMQIVDREKHINGTVDF